MSGKQEHSQFLSRVSEYIEANPTVAAYVSDAVCNGLQRAQDQTLERAADMEVALALSLGRKSAHSTKTIVNKLQKWDGRSAIPWKTVIDKLLPKATP